MPGISFSRTLVDERFIYEAILGSRLSYGNGKNSDSMVFYVPEVDDFRLNLGMEDRRFIEARLNSGVHGEDKLTRCIPVSVRIKAPLKLLVELDTYKVGTVRQSSSLMHRVASRGHFVVEDFAFRDPTADHVVNLIAEINRLYDLWIAEGPRRSDTQGEWTDWQDMIPRSYIYDSQWFTSYAVLRNIYFQRKNHRMGLWKDFLGWMEALPHSFIITHERKEKNHGS